MCAPFGTSFEPLFARHFPKEKSKCMNKVYGHCLDFVVRVLGLAVSLKSNSEPLEIFV